MTNKANNAPDAEPAVELHEPTAEDVAVAAAADKGKDFGDWEFRPWGGIDHWVNRVTQASTFDLKKIPTEYR
jgi:hypothetical protein